MNANTLAHEVFRQNKIKSFVIWLNQQKQLFARGVDVDGNIVGYYSLTTSLINPSKKFNTPYNFRDTGQMFRSFRVDVVKDGFTIDADAEKLVDSDIIEDENEILGLTADSMELLVKEIIPELAKEVTKQILQ